MVIIDEDAYIYEEKMDVKKISKKYKFASQDYKYKKIDEMEITEVYEIKGRKKEISKNMPNIIIYKNNNRETKTLINIISSIRIIITEYIHMEDIDVIPETIEYIIVSGEIYKNDINNKFELIDFIPEYRIISNHKTTLDYIKDLEKEDKINIINYRGWTVIDQLLKEISINYGNIHLYDEANKLEYYLYDIIDKIDPKKLRSKYNGSYNIFHYVRTEKLTKKLLKILDKKFINEDKTLLFLSFNEKLKIEILKYLYNSTINNVVIINNNKMTILTDALQMNFINLATEIIKRMDKKNILQTDIDYCKSKNLSILLSIINSK